VLDLGFFASIQSLQWTQEPATTIEGLIAVVQKVWDEYDPVKLNRVWLTHQTVLNEILAHYGGNDYNIPHMGKELLELNNMLPLTIEVSREAEEAMEIMNLYDVNVEEEEDD
jgi:hypothetical protein